MRLVREGLALLAVLTFLTGIVYSFVMTGVGEVLFPTRARGSMIRRGGQVVGSRLIGQPFTNPAYFWSRPSATSGYPCNAALSSGSNLGPSNPVLQTLVAERIATLRSFPGADPAAPVPVDLVTASGSGLDPHTSPAAAFYQIGRVAATRGVPVQEVRTIVERRIESRQIGLLGEARVNVLLLNLDLDKRFGAPEPGGIGAEGRP